MTFDEQELSERLKETAARVSAPLFTAADLSRQIRRRRARVAGAVAGLAVAVAVVAAVAVAVPAALHGPGQSAAPGSASRPGISRPASVRSPGYSITVNGQALAFRAGYAIIPGQDLTIIVDVKVPARTSLSALWIGITNGVLSPRRDGPADMSPILARTGTPLGPGMHRFRLHWVTPGGLRAGDSRQLSVEWQWSEPGDYESGGEEIIAELNVAGTAG